MKNYTILFKNNNFFSLWLGQLVAALGDRFTQMSLLTLVMIVSGDSGEKMAWITFYSLLPFLLFGQVFGILGDRYRRARLMIIADIGRAVLVAVIPFVIKADFGYVYAVLFCVGTFSALFYPAKLALTPNIVDKDYLVAANSLIISTGMISTLFGTLLAGIVIGFIGPYPSLYFNAATFVVSALMISRINAPAQAAQKEKLSLKNIYSNIREGLAFINRHQLVFRTIQMDAVFSFLSSFFYIIIINYSAKILRLDSTGYGILLSFLGVGLCLGAFLLGKTKGRADYSFLLSAGFFFTAFSNFMFIVKPGFWPAAFLLIAGGAGGAIIMISLNSLLQRLVPDSIRANVFGARGIITNFVFLAGLALVGKLVNVIDVNLIFSGLGAISLAMVVLIYLSKGQLGYRIFKGLLKAILKMFFALKVKGLENLPVHGKVILAGNHTSLMDGVIVMAAYPRKVYFLMAQEAFKKEPIGLIARHMGFIPIKRAVTALNKEAIGEAIRILEGRDTVGIFPEGKISPDGNMGEGKRGAALIALKSQASIIPFAIEGAYYAWPVKNKYPRRHPVEIRFGKPLDIREYGACGEVTDDVMDRIKKIKRGIEIDNLAEVNPNVIVRRLINA